MTVHQLKPKESTAITFEDFWQIYPRRKARAAAKRAFDRLNVTPELWDQIVTALEWQKREWSDPRFIPHASTWLNQCRWEDEPDVEVSPCAWTGCSQCGVEQYRNGKTYCQQHMAALERGETPVGR